MKQIMSQVINIYISETVNDAENSYFAQSQ